MAGGPFRSSMGNSQEPTPAFPSKFLVDVATMHEKRTDEIIKIQSALYDKGSSYTNLILVAGYAGFFAVWANMKSLMTPLEMRIAALSVLGSLTVFIVFELYKIAFLTVGALGLQQVIDLPPEQFEAAYKEHQRRERRRVRVLQKAWPFAFGGAIVPALVGGGTLAASFVRKRAAIPS